MTDRFWPNFCTSSASAEKNRATPIKAFKIEAGGSICSSSGSVSNESIATDPNRSIGASIQVIFSLQDPENLTWIPNSNNGIHSQDGGTPKTKIFPPLQHRRIWLVATRRISPATSSLPTAQIIRGAPSQPSQMRSPSVRMVLWSFLTATKVCRKHVFYVRLQAY